MSKRSLKIVDKIILAVEKQWAWFSSSQFAKKMQAKGLWRIETAALVLGFLAGLASFLSQRLYQQQLESKLANDWQTIDMLAAAQDLPRGTVLQQHHLQRTPVLYRSRSDNMLRPDNAAMILDRALLVDLKKGDLFTLSIAEGAVDGERISEKIPTGKRLVTLKIGDNGTAIAWMKPGDHVDLVSHTNLPGRGPTTFTVLQDQVVVAVGGKSSANIDTNIESHNVSFFVSPEEFEVLTFAQTNSTFSISLRNSHDSGRRNKLVGVDQNKFWDHEGVRAASGGGALDIIEDGVHRLKRPTYPAPLK